MAQPDLVESSEPRSRRTSSIAVAVVVIVLLGIAWRTSLSQTAPEPQTRAATNSVTPRPPSPTPTTPSPAPVFSDLPSAVPVGSDPTLLAARQAAWLETLHRRAMYPSPYIHVARRDLRTFPSAAATGAEDYGAAHQMRDAAGDWVDLPSGAMGALPVRDASGTYAAFDVGRDSSSHRRIYTWVYVVAIADGHVVWKVRLDQFRHVVGWLGNRLILAAPSVGETVQLLDWQRVTPMLDDLGPDSRALRTLAGDITIVTAGGDHGCLSVWRFAESADGDDVCPDDQMLAMSPDGRFAISHDLHWVRLSNGRTTSIGGRPDGVVARSASFLPDGSALVDLTLDGSSVEATLLCSREAGCRRVVGRLASLLAI